jgi:hypothetical protein
MAVTTTIKSGINAVLGLANLELSTPDAAEGLGGPSRGPGEAGLFRPARIRHPAERARLRSRFHRLDSSHELKPGYDVLKAMFEFLPLLQLGVIVHFHPLRKL